MADFLENGEGATIHTRIRALEEICKPFFMIDIPPKKNRRCTDMFPLRLQKESDVSDKRVQRYAYWYKHVFPDESRKLWARLEDYVEKQTYLEQLTEKQRILLEHICVLHSTLYRDPEEDLDDSYSPVHMSMLLDET